MNHIRNRFWFPNSSMNDSRILEVEICGGKGNGNLMASAVSNDGIISNFNIKRSVGLLFS